MLICLALSVCLQATPPKPDEPAAALPSADALIKVLSERISLGAQVRFRAEYRDPVAYTNTAASREDDDIYLSRVRLNLKFKLADNIDIFLQPQDQRTFGDETSVLSDENNFDVHQAYVDFKDIHESGVSVKIGRQEFQYGDQRLVSPLDWSNIARAWDGGRVRYGGSKIFWAEAFYTVIKEGTGAEDDQDFWGLYASFTGLENHEFDLYVFGRELNDNSQPGETIPAAIHDRRDQTYGVRLKGKAFGLDYTAEGMLQRGTVDEDSVRAWAGAATLGYTLDAAWKPRLGVEYTHASGDGNPTDGKIKTFDPLFPFGHFYQGFADVFAFKNGSDFTVTFKVAPEESLSFHLDYHIFRLDQEEDAWYNAAGTAIRRDATGSSGDEIGSELDFHVRFAATKNVKLWAGWSHVFAGSYIEDTPGSDRDMNWFFLQLTVEM